MVVEEVGSLQSIGRENMPLDIYIPNHWLFNTGLEQEKTKASKVGPKTKHPAKLGSAIKRG
jgi:hypothetical protein